MPLLLPDEMIGPSSAASATMALVVVAEIRPVLSNVPVVAVSVALPVWAMTEPLLVSPISPVSVAVVLAEISPLLDSVPADEASQAVPP